jgi:arylsulfatase A-like enzyme
MMMVLGCALPGFTAERPNLLFIYADDIGYEALGSYGGKDFKTPQLDEMAAQGLRFTRAYASPVCTPSRVSMHTGLYPHNHRHYEVLPVHNGTNKKVDFIAMPTWAQLMRANGYATSVTGKWQLATIERWPNHIREAGFDSWCVWQIWLQGKKTTRHWQPTINHDGIIRQDIAERFGPDVLVDYVIAQMTAATKAGKPFAIVHNELLPHDPIIQTPADKAAGRAASLGHMIHYMDVLVGRLLTAIDTLGIRDNTYVIFMGDNGTHEEDFINPEAHKPGQGAHTRHTTAGLVNGGKFQLNDAGTHVPLIVWGPARIPRAQTCDALIDVADLFPTFCALTGITLPSSLTIDGQSFVHFIYGQEGPQRAWTMHGIHQEDTIFDGTWRLFRKKGSLIDASNLPQEKPAGADDPSANTARSQLDQIFSEHPVGK